MSRFISLTIVRVDQAKAVKETGFLIDPAGIFTLERLTLPVENNRIITVTNVQAVKDGVLVQFHAREGIDIIETLVAKALEQRTASRTFVVVPQMGVPAESPETPSGN